MFSCQKRCGSPGKTSFSLAFLSQQAELTALLTQERQTVGTQNQQIEEANQSSQKLRAHLNTQQADSHQAGEELEAEKAASDRLRQTLATTEETLSRVSAENQQLLQKHTELQQQNCELTDRVETLQEHFTDKQAENV